jgi:RimK family alpha-L-glutamate ligase
MKPFDGVMDDVSLREELNTAGAVLTFGRFNPPTSGHELLVNKVLTEAKKRGADNFIFASHSKDKRKNPLDSKTKTNYMKTFFRNANVMYNPSIRTIFDAIGYLADEGYKEITVVVGGDRVDEFEKTIRPYVNHPDPDKSFDLNSFKVVSAGRRDPDATDVTGMSASKMRQAASEGDFETFKKGVPSKANDRMARKLFDDLRKAMGIREETFGHVTFSNFLESKRVPKTRKNQDPDTHSDLYTDEDPKGTIHGLGFKDVETAEASVRKIKASDRTHAHKIQAAIAMEQRAKVMKKTAEAGVYRKFIDQMKKKTKEMNEERKASKPVKVLVFSGYSEENDNNMMKTAKRIKEECKKRSVPCFVAFVPFARSFKNDDGTRTVVNKDGKEFIANRFDTVVVVRGAASGQSGTLDMISSFEKDGFFVINSRDSIEICSDKYRTSVTLVEAGLPTPRTALVTDPDMIEDVHKQVGGKFPVVAKTLTGSKGQGVFIIDSKPSLNSVIDAIQKIDEEEEIILQEYIDMKSDMRIIVLDGKVVGVMNRGKVKNDFRSNFSMGAKIKKVSISNEIEDLALKAAKVIGCYYCGVDIAISAKTKKPYIIEVNSSPGSEGIEMATKQNIVGDFIDHILDKDNWMYSPTIVGRRETLSIEGIGPVVGKFDTGNMVVNSIHADNYEINGDTVTWTHGGKTFTNKVVDILTVLQGAIAHDVEKRPMIELDIEFMGKKYPKRRFTLDDRSQKGTPVLVGVPFMKEFGIIVDPGKTFIKTEKLTEATLTKKEMQLRDKYAKDLKKDRTSEFKKRYGKDYKEVIFATATNMAKKEQRKEEEYHSGNLDGTTELTRKRKRMTPGQFNEMATDYFNRRTK